ncbi:MAG TPA: hypothetical protein VHA56_02295 [Mucilaginibacter sp.]|nr:hypothetical protein [Mucilaginibacter sp.]
MNWKLIFQLSIFGLIMAFGTVSLIPQDVEVAFWLFIFAFCAAVIARACNSKYFLHGFFTGLVNCVWITIVHCFFFQKYIADHKKIDTMTTYLPASFDIHPRLGMALVGLGPGIISALVFGLFAFAASKMISKKPV